MNQITLDLIMKLYCFFFLAKISEFNKFGSFFRQEMLKISTIIIREQLAKLSKKSNMSVMLFGKHGMTSTVKYR